MMEKLWCVFVAVRMIVVIIPQTGYIHPDEFFQTTEIVAGDLLDIEVNRPWEFNSSQPIRSIVLPFLILGIPVKIGKMLFSYQSTFQMGYLCLILTRLTMAIFSLTVDLFLFKLCRFLKLDTEKSLLLLSSSYVMLIFLTRTFTNSFETYLFSMLLSLVFTESENYQIYIMNNPNSDLDLKNSEKKTTFKKYNKKRQKQPKGKVENRRNNLELQTHHSSIVVSVGIGIITVMGIFNRPTFIAFAVVPILYWLYLCFVMNKVMRNLLITSFVLAITFTLFVLLDSLYYHPNMSLVYHCVEECIAEKLPSQLECIYRFIRESSVVTPWNFIYYNTRIDNLAEHGIHPRYLHFIVNLPLLYGPLYICSIVKFFNTFVKCLKGKTNFIDVFFSTTFITPVVLLSLFPHQEPRFLIPLLPLAVISSVHFIQCSNLWRFFIILLFMFNIPLFVLFGFLHQGGLIPCLLHIQSCLQSGNYSEHDRFIFYHTYMPPRHLLHSKSANSQVVDLQGMSNEQLQYFINVTFLTKHTELKEKPGKFYLILPGTLENSLYQHRSYNFSVSSHKIFHYHLSMEDPPDISILLSKLYTDLSLVSLNRIFNEFINQASLHMMSINMSIR